MSSDLPQNPEPAIPTPPATVIEQLRSQLAQAKLCLTRMLAVTSPVDSPTTYQTFRWLGGAMEDSANRLRVLMVAAEIPENPFPMYELTLPQITDVLEGAENRVIQALGPWKLDVLPEGKMGEPVFEAKLKKLIFLNRVYEEALRSLAGLDNALKSDTYKLILPEADRQTAWRKQRRAELEKVLDETTTELAAQEKFIAQLRQAKEKVVKQLEENDQMSFLEIDPQQPPHIGEDAPKDGPVPSPGESTDEEFSPKHPPQ